MFQIKTYKEEETILIAKELAKELNIRDIIILTGDLGCGKTKFTQGILSHFNLEKEISSPTFTIVNEYLPSNNAPIFHFDVYRLADIDEFYAIGGDEYFEKGICIIEWGELLEPILPQNYLKISFSKDLACDDGRILTFEPHGDRFIGKEWFFNNENFKYNNFKQ